MGVLIRDENVIFGGNSNGGGKRPSAYLNYILFDKNYNFLDMGWTAVPATSNFAKQQMTIPTVNVKEPGYVFVYLTYEAQSNNWIYFDDFKVTHTKTNVIQSNDYYPFGLQASTSWTRDNNKNNFLYDAAGELNSTTGWYDLFFRNYDPVLGRFMQVDPLAASYVDLSPYNYAGNNPVLMNDPLGDKVSLSDPHGAKDRQAYLRAYASEWSMNSDLYFRMGTESEVEELLIQLTSRGGGPDGIKYSYNDKGQFVGSIVNTVGVIGLIATDNATGKQYYLNVSIEDGSVSGIVASSISVDPDDGGFLSLSKGQVFDVEISQRGETSSGIPLGMWVDPSSLRLKKIAEAWYGSAHINEEIAVLKIPFRGLVRVHLNTTVNFHFSANGGYAKKNVAQYLAATAMDKARSSIMEQLYANPGMSSATAAKEFKEIFGIYLMMGTFGSEVKSKSYSLPGVPTSEVRFQWFPSMPPRDTPPGF